MTKEELGRLVRKAWVLWAYNHNKNPKPEWLLPYDEIAPHERVAADCMGMEVALAVRDDLIKRVIVFEQNEFDKHRNYEVSNALDRLVLRLRQEGVPE